MLSFLSYSGARANERTNPAPRLLDLASGAGEEAGWASGTMGGRRPGEAAPVVGGDRGTEELELGGLVVQV